jgi:glycosyltransferase involved in cell wall biosynthesis
MLARMDMSLASAALRERLRVAVVTETYPPEVNGVALSLQHVVEGLHARGHWLQLIRPRLDPADRPAPRKRFDELLVRGMPIPRYPGLRMGLPARGALTALWSAQRPDLVHIATEGPLGWSALKAALQLKLPLVSDFRTNFHAYSRHYGIGWLQRPIVSYLRGFHNRTAVTMVPTEGLRAELTGLGFERLAVVMRGVDTQAFDPALRSAALRATWSAGAHTPVMLFVGRLAPEKNLGLLVESFAALRALRPDARLVVVGDGPSRAVLRAAVPDAVFAGTRRGTDLAAHYASADAFVFPSMTETFGNVTPEAMASGLAVVAFDHAAAGQLLRHGENGLLAPLGDGAAFVRCVQRLAREPALAAACGAAARVSMHALAWERVVAQVEAQWWAARSGGVAAAVVDASSARPHPAL